MTELVKSYNNTPIHFEVNGRVMVNATEMAKPFGKNVSNYLRMSSTSELLQELVQTANSQFENHKNDFLEDDFLRVVRGGRHNGTWMEETLAIDFAGWLSPKFKVWMYRTFKTLLQEKSSQHGIFIEEYKRMNNLKLQEEIAKAAYQDTEEYRSYLEAKAERQEQQKYVDEIAANRLGIQASMF